MPALEGPLSADATLDSDREGSKQLWLQNWGADPSSKQRPGTIPREYAHRVQGRSSCSAGGPLPHLFLTYP